MYLHGRGLGGPFNRLQQAVVPLLLQAAPNGGVADGQVVGAAVHLVVAAHSVVQGAAGPGETVAEELPLAAACASCGKTS